MGYRDPVSKKMISRARYDELIAAGLPADKIDNRKKQPAAASSAEIAEDTIEETPASAKMKPGAKRVAAKSTEIGGEFIAGLVKMSTDKIIRDERKQIESAEAKSIGLPLSRIVSRHIPAWLKKYLPAGSGNDDISDLQEVAASLAKWGIRFVMITVADYQAAAEARKQKRSGQAAAEARAMQPAQPAARPVAQPAARPEQNGHAAAPAINSLIAAYGVDLGGEGL